ncbi:MAG: lipoyl(octanoyl) transferase LipB [Deltaproteobacteria bacterium]|nr:lipoyl(octanoyl) transferase LipB [Deltaproteobacteria bacterium]
MTKVCTVYNLGLVDYRQGLSLQEKLLASRKAGVIPDVLLLLEHPSVFTMGLSGADEHIMVPADALAEEGIPVFSTNRGGDVTYHGPGQIVGYPILSLRENDLTVHQYIWNLEEVVLRTLTDYGIDGQRIEELRGVWVRNEKVCSIGVRVSGATTMHGFALNVNNDLKFFSYIVPCGITGVSMTSVAKLLGHEVEIKETQEILLRHFSSVFGLHLQNSERPDEWLNPSNPHG